MQRRVAQLDLLKLASSPRELRAVRSRVANTFLSLLGGAPAVCDLNGIFLRKPRGIDRSFLWKSAFATRLHVRPERFPAFVEFVAARKWTYVFAIRGSDADDGIPRLRCLGEQQVLVTTSGPSSFDGLANFSSEVDEPVITDDDGDIRAYRTLEHAVRGVEVYDVHTVVWDSAGRRFSLAPTVDSIYARLDKVEQLDSGDIRRRLRDGLQVEDDSLPALIALLLDAQARER